MARSGVCSLTDQRATKILDLVRRGNYLGTACRAVGVSQRTVNRWRARGREGKQPYKQFLVDLSAALAEAEAHHVENIREAASKGDGKNWTASAWWLERTNPKKWARPELLNVRATVKHEGVVHVTQIQMDRRFGPALRGRLEVRPAIPSPAPALPPPAAAVEREATPTDEEVERRAGRMPTRQITGTVAWAGPPLWAYQPPPPREPRPDSSATAGLMKRDF
jgi:hypothetical protein